MVGGVASVNAASVGRSALHLQTATEVKHGLGQCEQHWLSAECLPERMLFGVSRPPPRTTHMVESTQTR